jgi:hypothetical protein
VTNCATVYYSRCDDGSVPSRAKRAFRCRFREFYYGVASLARIHSSGSGNVMSLKSFPLLRDSHSASKPPFTTWWEGRSAEGCV